MNKGGKDLQISMDGEGDRIVTDGELTVLIKGKILDFFQKKNPKRNEMLILGMVD